MDEIVSEKQRLRGAIIAKRGSISPAKRKKASQTICDRVLSVARVRDAKTICIYASKPSEIDTKKLIEAFLDAGKTVVIPETTAHGGADLRQVTGVDVFIIPGVAFDRHGHRLGRGGGYYDRLLKDVTVLKVGLAYDVQVVAEVPYSSYDISMDIVITEREIIHV